MKIDMRGVTGPDLRLGIQSNPSHFMTAVHAKARDWAPQHARSYTILVLRNEDYHGHAADGITGYGTMTVAYFTTAKEGKNKLGPPDPKAPDTFTYHGRLFRQQPDGRWHEVQGAFGDATFAHRVEAAAMCMVGLRQGGKITTVEEATDAAQETLTAP